MGLTLIQALAVVESSGNTLAMRYEPSLDKTPPRWLMAGMANLQIGNPLLSFDAEMKVLSTSFGRYQILGGNLYGPSVCFNGPISDFLFDDNQQDYWSLIFIQKIAGEHGLSASTEVADISDTVLEDFSSSWNGPGNPSAYAARLREADKRSAA
jgi:hypothetical protein